MFDDIDIDIDDIDTADLDYIDDIDDGTRDAEYALECAAASASYGRDDYYSGDTDNDYSGDY